MGTRGNGRSLEGFRSQAKAQCRNKVLNADLREEPDFVARFTHEAQLVASLHHQNIVQIHDFQFADDAGDHKGPLHPSTPPSPLQSIAYMVMDYVEGATLAD